MHGDEPLREGLEAEFRLPALDQVQGRLASLHTDTEALMRQLIR